MDSNWYNEIFELKFYRLKIIPKPFGAFDFVEKVKSAWYMEKNEELWWGRSASHRKDNILD